VVEDYSSRKLTKEDDKLPALSGFAKNLAMLTRDIYYAGLWRDHIFEDLCWIVFTRSESLGQVPAGFPHSFGLQFCFAWRPNKYQAPTWSWASLEYTVRFVYLDFERIVATFVGADTTPVRKDKFGQVSDGWIKLK